MTTITIEKAKQDLDQLIERARAGEEIVITDGTKPPVKLEAVEVEAKSDALRQRPGAGRYKGLLVSNEDLFGLLPDEEQWKRRGFGILKGKIQASDEALFGPLPDDELALWNGEGD